MQVLVENREIWSRACGPMPCTRTEGFFEEVLRAVCSLAPHVAPTTISTVPAGISRASQSTRLDIDRDDSSTRIGRVTSCATAVESVARGRSTFDHPAREPPRSTHGLRQLSDVSPCNGPATDLRTATPAEQEPDDTPPRRPRSAHIRRVRREHTSPEGNLLNESDGRSRKVDAPENARSTGRCAPLFSSRSGYSTCEAGRRPTRRWQTVCLWRLKIRGCLPLTNRRHRPTNSATTSTRGVSHGGVASLQRPKVVVSPDAAVSRGDKTGTTPDHNSDSQFEARTRHDHDTTAG